MRRRDFWRTCRIAALVLATGLQACASVGAHEPKKETARTPAPFSLDPYPSTYKPLARKDTLITNVMILDGLGGRMDHGAVLLRDGKIVALGPDAEKATDVTVVDGKGRWLTPGVIDVHSHDGTFSMPLTAQEMQSSDVSEETDPNTANVWVEHSIAIQDPSFSRALAGGVTTLQVLPGSVNLFGGRSVVLKTVPATTVQAMKFPGAPYGMKMACGENPKFFYGSKGRFPSSRMGNVAGYREAWIKAKDYKDRWDRYESGEAEHPPARDLKLDTLAGVLNGDIRVHMHCYRADEMAYILDLSKEFGYHVTAFHHAVEAYKIADLLRQADVCAAVWSDWWGYKMEAYDGIRENAAFVDAAGGCVMMHSDSPVIGQRLNIEAGKAMAAGRRAGLDIPPERAIRWITSNPAKALGLGDRIGAIAVGRNADLVIWSGDPFSIYTKADDVFIDGALVYARGDAARTPKSDFEVGQPAQEGTRP